jgi:hypothetical protein
LIRASTAFILITPIGASSLCKSSFADGETSGLWQTRKTPASTIEAILGMILETSGVAI